MSQDCGIQMSDPKEHGRGGNQQLLSVLVCNGRCRYAYVTRVKYLLVLCFSLVPYYADGYYAHGYYANAYYANEHYVVLRPLKIGYWLKEVNS